MDQYLLFHCYLDLLLWFVMERSMRLLIRPRYGPEYGLNSTVTHRPMYINLSAVRSSPRQIIVL